MRIWPSWSAPKKTPDSSHYSPEAHQRQYMKTVGRISLSILTAWKPIKANLRLMADPSFHFCIKRAAILVFPSLRGRRQRGGKRGKRVRWAFDPFPLLLRPAAQARFSQTIAFYFPVVWKNLRDRHEAFRPWVKVKTCGQTNLKTEKV